MGARGGTYPVQETVLDLCTAGRSCISAATAWVTPAEMCDHGTGKATESGHREEGACSRSADQKARAGGLEEEAAAALCSLGLGILGSIARDQTDDLLKDIAQLEAELLKQVGSSSNKRKKREQDDDASAVGKQSRRHRSKRACVLCKVHAPAVAFVPCGHAACEDCGFKDSECPESCPSCGSALSPSAPVQRIFLS